MYLISPSLFFDVWDIIVDLKYFHVGVMDPKSNSTVEKEPMSEELSVLMSPHGE